MDQLTIQPVDDIRSWTHELLRQLAGQRSSGVTGSDVELLVAGEVLPPQRQQPVAQALCDYLVRSPEFGYTLDRPRKDKTIDPTLDFLVNVKQGHCERFASALALMLRSVKVPARIVKGFRGADSLGDGQYQVRQSDAHSWVEAVITRVHPDGTRELGWLTLDPTPLGDTPTAEAFSLSLWWSTHMLTLETLWRDFILNYSPEKQQTLAQTITDGLGLEKGWKSLRQGDNVWTPLALAVGSPLLFLAGAWTVQRFKPRSRRRPVSAPVATLSSYVRLLALLHRSHGLTPVPSQTPREFSDAAHAALLRGAQAAAFAEVPAQVVALLYRSRYGGRPPSPAETQAVESGLDQLDQALEDDRVTR
jgi:hypothetical protein